MNFKNKLRWKIVLPAISIVLLLLVNALHMTRIDVVAACKCTKEIFLSKQDEINVVRQNRQAIMNEAKHFDLPPELLAAIIYNHQRDLTSFRIFTDCVGSALGGDFSLGPAQVRISTAIQSENRRLDAITPREFKFYRASLLDPTLNIRYQAKELRSLLEREDRSPGITSVELMNRPQVMSLLLSEYRMGRKSSLRNSTGFGAGSLGALRLLMDNENLYMFARSFSDSLQIREKIRDYLDYVFCSSGIFNPSACERWRESIAVADQKNF
ncbi:MAG: hypothetical protein P8Y80_03740 [Acidobacteriota bacterium]